VLALAAFALLAVAYEREPLASVDAEVSEWVAMSLPGWLERVARPFSWLGGWPGMTAVGVATGIVLLRERSWLDLGFLVAALAGSAVAVGLLKAGFDRARPDLGSAVPLPESASFPSGHATSGIAGLGAVAVLVSERLPNHRARVGLWSAAVVVGASVGLSRIALNVHYVTDVLAGWCFGLAWLAACLLARDTFARRTVRSRGA
jgi:membrane-associated phospholipid phosphatase